MLPVKLPLFLVYAYLITVVVCDDGWSELSTPWGVIKYQHEKEIRGKMCVHTLDLYYNKGPAEGCNVVKMDDSARAKVVRLHNEKRRQVAKGLELQGDPGPQPPARRMLRVEYDRRLEVVAEAYISQCIFDHDKFREIDGFYSVGQSLCINKRNQPFTDLDWWKGCIEGFYREVKDFSKYSTSYYTSRTDVRIGHYAQLVYESANRIGCAEAIFKVSDSSNPYRLLAGCVYGNAVYVRKALYEQGKPCEGVNEHCDDGLVTTEEIGAKAAFSVGDTSFVNIPQWSRDIPHSTAKRHVLDYPGPAEGCSPREMTHADRERVVNIHNSRRRKVAKGLEHRGEGGPQPGAENMQKMEYDPFLEHLAMAWVSRCDKTDNANINIDRYKTIGRNVLTQRNPAPFDVLDWADIIDRWYDQVENIKTVKSRTTYPSPTDYFQIVHADAAHVGCAHAVYVDFTIYEKPMFVRLSTCYYAEGLTDGKPLYKNGKSCSGSGQPGRYCDDGLITAEIPIDCTPHEMTGEERKQVVNTHNELRKEVAKGMEGAGRPGPQPPAANMMRMEYDRSLEDEAKAAILKCPDSFDQSAMTRSRSYSVGQNSAWVSLLKPPHVPVDWEDVIQDWYSEVGNFNRDHVASYNAGNFEDITRTYAQIAKDTASRVGCATAIYVVPTAEERYKRVIVCKYRDGLTTGRLYQEGQPCSNRDPNCDDGLLKPIRAKL